jgi:V8-like Glu-specific endopeptidase
LILKKEEKRMHDRTTTSRRAQLLMLVLVLMLASSVTVSATVNTAPGGTPGVERPAAAPQPTAEPCLADDPFNLARLRTVISDDTPPTAPVRINEHMLVSYLGNGKIVADIPDDADPDPATGGPREPSEPGVAETSYGLQRLRVFNNRTLAQFQIQLDSSEMASAIHRCREAAGLTSASGGPDGLGAIEGQYLTHLPAVLSQGTGATAAGRAEEPLEPAGWSNGVDTRIVRTPTTQWPWRTIAQSSLGAGQSQNSRCTFTLIGPRHLITAAHCIVNFGTQNWKARQITPGRNGENVSPYGNSFISPNPAPGTEAWYFVPDPWLNPNTTDKWQWDWGLIVIPDRLGDLTGWMGYVARPASALNPLSHYNRGYPSCSSDYPERPAGCQTARLYGDTQNCGIGGYYYEGPDGWNRVFSISCDLSRGHSGSAVYHYFYDPNLQKTVPVVTAMVSTQSCTTCGAGDNYPNRARRITPADLGVISWLRETFP